MPETALERAVQEIIRAIHVAGDLRTSVFRRAAVGSVERDRRTFFPYIIEIIDAKFRQVPNEATQNVHQRQTFHGYGYLTGSSELNGMPVWHF